MPQQQDLTVRALQFVEGASDPLFDSRASGSRWGSCPPRQTSPRDKRANGRRALSTKTLLGRRFSLCDHVPAMQVDQPIERKFAEPGVERHRPLLEIVGQLPGGLDERVLDDVGCVDAVREPAIHSKRDHSH